MHAPTRFAGVVLSALLAGCAGAAPSGSASAPAPAPAPHAARDTHDAHAAPGSGPSPSEAQARLAAGNVRFVAGRPEHPHQSPDERSAVAHSQSPFAMVLDCSDSRVGPELIFDQGLGDLFVARVAGNVIDDHVVGSFEYAVEHLHSPLLVVLGHQRCGAVAAARDTFAAHGHAEGHIQSLLDAIRPAVEATLGEDAEATCKANVRAMVAALRASQPILKRNVDSGAIAVVGAYYDLDTGAVSFLADD